MKNAGKYIWICLFIVMTGLPACKTREKTLVRRITLQRRDKIPYGTYVAFDNLKSIFPNAEVTVNRESPSLFAAGGNGKKAYIIITDDVNPDQTQWDGIMNFVGQGNSVFISAFYFGDTILHYLKVRQAHSRVFRFENMDSLRVSVRNRLSGDSLSFFYPGDAADDYATEIDTQYTSVLGRDSRGRPDFLKFRFKGGGAVYLHFAPMAFTNFFLLFGNNKGYYENALSYLPVSTTEVKWDEYFPENSGGGGRARPTFPLLSFLTSSASLTWAMWLLLLLFLLVLVFESKRRQRPIVVIPPLRNTSLEFVKTIGRLYYQRRDNQNLALKMAAFFQDHVRTKFRLNMPGNKEGEDAFVRNLAHRTGYDAQALSSLVARLRELRESGSLSDEDLLELNRRLEDFYKQA